MGPGCLVGRGCRMFTRHLGEPWAGQCSGPWDGGAAGRSSRVRPWSRTSEPSIGRRSPPRLWDSHCVHVRGQMLPVGKQFHLRLPAVAPAEAQPSPGRLGRLTRPSWPREPVFHAPWSEVQPTLWHPGRNLHLDVVGPCTRSSRESLSGRGTLSHVAVLPFANSATQSHLDLASSWLGVLVGPVGPSFISPPQGGLPCPTLHAPCKHVEPHIRLGPQEGPRVWMGGGGEHWAWEEGGEQRGSGQGISRSPGDPSPPLWETLGLSLLSWPGGHGHSRLGDRAAPPCTGRPQPYSWF